MDGGARSRVPRAHAVLTCAEPQANVAARGFRLPIPTPESQLMMSIRARSLSAALLLTATSALAELSLVPVSTYDTGLGANGAEIVSIRKSDQLAAITNIAGSIDLV